MKFVNYKILIVTFLVIGLVIFLINTTREIIEIRNEGSVVKRLENELDQKERYQIFLQEQLKYVQTDEFIDKASREKLGLVKPGEVIVQETFESNIQNNIEAIIEKPNWQQWLELFM